MGIGVAGMGFYYLLAAVPVGMFSTLYAFLLLFTKPPRWPTSSELRYITPFPTKSGRTEYPLPSIFKDEATVDISVIIPAYNEVERLPAMLEESLAYLRQRRQRTEGRGEQYTWEILIMDDCSRDGTTQCALDWAKAHGRDCEMRIVRMTKNRGKGGCVKQAMMRARGKLMLMVDADGATKFSDLDLLEEELARIITGGGHGIAIGSRAHLTKTDAVVKRSFIRNFLMYSFHSVLIVLGIRGIADTQCGFKLFTRETARLVFPNQHVEGWIFDIEVLLLARRFGVPAVEVPVTWREVDGSKMRLAIDSINMLRDLVIVRGNYLLGLWKARQWEIDPYEDILNEAAAEPKKAI